MARTVRSLGVQRPGHFCFFEYDEEPPIEGQVQLETLYSGFSAGTELTFLKGTNPHLRSRFEQKNSVFIENEVELQYPIPFLGYMEVARVATTRADDFNTGDVVAATYAHKTGHIADPFHDLLVAVPQQVDPILGIFIAQMGPIAANGILHADAEECGATVTSLGCGIAGRNVIVVGGGTVGLLTALFAQASGSSEVVIVDPSEFRREKAEAMGLKAMPETQAWQYAKARWHDGSSDRGADFVFQTRAHLDSLNIGLKALRPQGTLIDLAFYQRESQHLNLGEEFHHNGLTIRCAQINRVPKKLATAWNRRRLAAETIDLLVSKGNLIAEHMITHVVPFDQAPAFISKLLERRFEFLQVVFKVER